MKKLASLFTALVLTLGVFVGSTVPSTTPVHASTTSIKVVASNLHVKHGHVASITIKTQKHAKGSIAVYYNSGKSKAAGLKSKKANNSGYIEWSWLVGTRTKKGTYNVYITVNKKRIVKKLYVK